MRLFFNSTRQRLGIVVLALACLFTTGWIRSLVNTDSIGIPIGGIYLVIESCGGQIGWQDLSQFSYYRPIGWSSVPNTFGQWGALEFVTFPYWYVVVPLVLLSAWLLLRKSTTRAQLNQSSRLH